MAGAVTCQGNELAGNILCSLEGLVPHGNPQAGLIRRDRRHVAGKTQDMADHDIAELVGAQAFHRLYEEFRTVERISRTPRPAMRGLALEQELERHAGKAGSGDGAVLIVGMVGKQHVDALEGATAKHRDLAPEDFLGRRAKADDGAFKSAFFHGMTRGDGTAGAGAGDQVVAAGMACLLAVRCLEGFEAVALTGKRVVLRQKTQSRPVTGRPNRTEGRGHAAHSALDTETVVGEPGRKPCFGVVLHHAEFRFSPDAAVH